MVSTLATSVLSVARGSWSEARHRVRELAPRQKGEHDVVTQMDLALERSLSRDLPDIVNLPVVAEESDEKVSFLPPDFDAWVVDPLDGTANFLAGWPHAISIALWRGGSVELGVVWVPRIDIAYMARQDAGAVMVDGDDTFMLPRGSMKTPLVIAGVATPSDDPLASGRFLADVWARADEVRMLGPASLDACKVSSGDASAYVAKGLHIWDWLAAALVVTESGGKVLGDGKSQIGFFCDEALAERFCDMLPLVWDGASWT